MIYKKSQFTEIIFLPESNIYILYNTLTGGIAALEINNFDFYNENTRFDTALQIDKTNEKFVNLLIQEKYIVPFSFNEIEYLKAINTFAKYSSDSATVFLAPTLSCNMCCPYCYEQGATSSSMSNTTFDNVILYLEKLFKKAKHFQLVWYGGEPLVETEQIFSNTKSIASLCQKCGIELSVSMISNGYLLSKECARNLAEQAHMTSAQITVDGPAELHNSRRKLKNGNESFDTIINNIKTASKYMQVNIRVNVDRINSPFIPELISVLEEQNILQSPNITLHCAPVRSLEKDPNNYTWQSYAEWFNDYMTMTSQKLSLKQLMGFLPNAKVNTCMMNRAIKYVIAPDGGIFKCLEQIQNPECAIGNVNATSERVQIINEYRIIENAIPQECNVCGYLPICQGYCPIGWEKSREEWCNFQKLSHLNTIKLIYDKSIHL